MIERGLQTMLKFIKLEEIPEGLDIKFNWCVTESILISSVGREFENEARSMSPGNACVIVDVPEEYKDEIDIFKLVEVSSNTRAYVFLNVCRHEPKPRISVEESVWLRAPIDVIFKVPGLPDGFKGAVYKFKERENMHKRIYSDFHGFKLPLEDIEPEMYYICLVLLEDYEGQLNYERIINKVKYSRLTAYYLH